MRRIAPAALAAAVLLLSSPPAAAEPTEPIADPVRVSSPLHCESAGGSVLDFPARWVHASPEWWDRTDTEVRRLQDAETRLTAENKALKMSARNSRPRWYWIVSALTAGALAGYVYRWAE